MYVCLCKAVTEADILDELDAGAQSLHDVQQSLGVGSQCGSCTGCARALIAEYHAEHEAEAADGALAGMAIPA